MKKSKESSTPMLTSCYLDEKAKHVYESRYKGIIGSLLYLTPSHRDIMHNVCVYARFQANPKESHLVVLKRILMYIKGALKVGLWYSKGASISLFGYSNLDYAGCKVDRKATSGTSPLLRRTLVSWHSKKQTCVALSIAEVEYVAFGSCFVPLDEATTRGFWYLP